MDRKTSLLRTLLVAFLIAIFLEVFLQPTAIVNPEISFGVILLVELVAYGLSKVYVKQSAQQLVRILFVSLVLSLFFVFVLKPSSHLGADSIVIIVFTIETLGLVAAWVLSRN